MNLQDKMTKLVIKPEQEMASVDWESTERPKTPWIKPTVHYGKTVKPQKDQKSNQPLTDAMVLQPRAEPIGNSAAPPISGRGQDKGMEESTRSKQTQSGFGVPGI
jgi:hypothetical protein